MLQIILNITQQNFLCMGGGQDKPAWTACPPGVKITRAGGKISRDSLPPGGQVNRGWLAPRGASCPGGKINWDTGSGFYQTSPGPDFICFESGFGSYQGSPEGESVSGFYEFVGPGSRFYPLSPGRGPDFIYFWVQVRVWILSSMSGSASGSGSGFYQHPSRPI